MRIVFMGTPDFALFSLEALTSSRHEIAAVVTQPDRPGNRGAVIFSPVKKYALQRGLPVLQFEKISRDGAETLRSLAADLFVTAAFGQILSREILGIPKFGIVNVHASLLPAYRGSSPIQWALINGERETGVTIMQTAAGLDTGDILLQKSLPIAPDDTAGLLFDKLGRLGACALSEYLDRLERGTPPMPVCQDETKATYFPMLKKGDGRIDWTRTAAEICNRVRGVDPWPGAFTSVGGKTLKLFGATERTESGIPGTVLPDRSGLLIACGQGSVRIGEVQLEGKKRMSSRDFMNGSRISFGEVLG